MMAVFISVVNAENKAERLKAQILKQDAVPPGFLLSREELGDIPGSPFAYWSNQKVRDTFQRLEPFEADGRIARKGLTTSNDERYVRLRWEVNPSEIGETWATYAKGGPSKKFYTDKECVVRWDWSKRTIPGYVGRPGRETETVECADLMGNPSLTWPLRSGSFSPSALPSRSVFSARGYVIQAPMDELEFLLAITSSSVFDYLFKLCLGRVGHPEFIVGILQKLPLPKISPSDRATLAKLARSAWSLARSKDFVNETCSAFILPAPLLNRVSAFNITDIDRQLMRLQAQIDELAYRLYGLSPSECVDPHTEVNETPEGELDIAEAEGEQVGETASLLSWCVGVAFGRFDFRLVTGERRLPDEPHPFAPVQDRSLGALPQGATPFRALTEVLVDDPGHPDDLVGAVGAVLSRCGVTQDGELSPDSIRVWLARDFWPIHIRMYSKSSRKAPIYWQLATASSRYSLWLYIHNLSQDTLFRVQNDYVSPKLAHERRQLESLISEAGANPSPAHRKAIESQQEFIEELQSLLDEFKRVAPLWNPNLDDGVIVNFAPLWRMLSHNKAWQKELKATWESLQRGDYDWAHLAMHLWPERVVPKCASDRSLAIAHRLEDVFWFQGESGKWKRRDTPTRPVSELVRERTSDAVKAALRDLLDASEPAGGSRRPRRKS